MAIFPFIFAVKLRKENIITDSIQNEDLLYFSYVFTEKKIKKILIYFLSCTRVSYIVGIQDFKTYTIKARNF